MPDHHHAPESIRDFVGVGFGPSNLALAVAVAEHNAAVPDDDPIDALFLEKKGQFGWHRGMLVDGATMQVSFLKDLVTLRNPTSDFSFVSYLHAAGRLVEFVNHKAFFPLRAEFHGYLEWAAGRVADSVRYGAEVTAIRPLMTGDQVDVFEIDERADDGTVRTHRARNVVLAPGLTPFLPDGVVRSARVWHNSELVPRVASADRARIRTAVVVGSGQSAAESADYLHRRLPDAEVHAVFSRYGYAPADDSPFANRIFDPSAVDDYFDAPGDVKDMLNAYHRNTNYSVVDGDLIADLYRTVYEERVLGRERLRIRHASRITALHDGPDHANLDIEYLPTGKTETLGADLVVYATGYRPSDALGLLGDAAGLCLRDNAGRPRLSRDYRVATAPHVTAGIYLQGGTEHTHGLSSTLLSNLAVRAGEILGSVRDRRRAATPHAAYATTGQR